MIKIAIPGSAGRMGMLIREIAAAPDLELQQQPIGQIALYWARCWRGGKDRRHRRIMAEPETLFGLADVVIDFTSPLPVFIMQNWLRHMDCHTGTTGLSADDEIELVATTKGNTVIYCANTSVGVTLLISW